MSLSFTDNKAYGWSIDQVRDDQFFFKGHIFESGDYLKGSEAAQRLATIAATCDDREQLISVLSKTPGNFAFCYLSQKWQLAMVDKKRSYPLFYHKRPKSLHLSNCPFILAKEYGLNTRSKGAGTAFEMAGYTIGKTTLFSDVQQLEAGEIMILEKGSENAQSYHYYIANRAKKQSYNEADWLQRLDAVHEKVFQRLVNSLNGRQVIIPLSGGYDSRLILAMLIKYGHRNIKTYTYGWPWLWEVQQAEQIARLAQVDWTFIKLDRASLLKRFHSKDRKSFYQFACGASSTPGIPEYYSIGILKEAGYISSDAVIINGQTGDFISGGHIPGFQTDDQGRVGQDQLLNAIIQKHFALWTNRMEKSTVEIQSQLIDLLRLKPNETLTLQRAADLFEQAEWSERQSKYIVNCVRAYEWFDYDWRLPLWDDEYMSFWDEVPIEFKKDQYLFKRYLRQFDPRDLFSMAQIDYTKTYPLSIKLAQKAIGIKSRIFGSDRTTDVRHYLKYHMEYGPFFPQKSYWAYLKDSKYHRNAVSYWSRYVLEEMP